MPFSLLIEDNQSANNMTSRLFSQNISPNISLKYGFLGTLFDLILTKFCSSHSIDLLLCLCFNVNIKLSFLSSN